MQKFIGLSRLVLVVLLFQFPSPASATKQFQQWYPELGDIFERIIRDNCSAEYTAYRIMKLHDAPVLHWTGGTRTNRLAHPVVDCILHHTSEFIKASMGSASVLLGLTPMILATMGNSVEEISTLIVVGRRPILGLFLAAGSPAVAPTRSFEYSNPTSLLEDRLHRLRPKRFSPGGEIAVVVLEYVLALLVIANTMTVTYELGLRAVSTFVPHVTYLPILWPILVLALHFFGTFVLWVRTSWIGRCNCRSALRLIKDQFLPLDDQITHKLKIQDESYSYIFFKLVCIFPLDLSRHLWHSGLLQFAFHFSERWHYSDRSVHGFSSLMSCYSHVQVVDFERLL